jgi:predicted short-subunit dehydrogenase-like oxidoreductase (DUF2520 family)
MLNYAIAGGGRLARHFSTYFQLLGIPYTCWARDDHSSLNTSKQVSAENRLRETVTEADCVLLLVSDNAITALLKQYPFLHEKQLVHCSGSLSFPGIIGVHPLMTFADQVYDLDTYQSVPFMVEKGHNFESLFPKLQNPHFTVGVEDKARYHAMCVMAGNFSQLIWKAVTDRFEEQFELPAETLQPYLNQVTDNFINVGGAALTGPLVRNDLPTIERNLNSLEGDTLQDLYGAFVQFYQNEQQRHFGLEKVI